MNRQTENRITELRLEEQPPEPNPAPAPAEPVEPAAPIVVPQFDESECLAGAMDDGETYGTVELAEGVQGITCRRSAEAPAEVQALAFDPTAFDEETAKAWAESNEFLAWSKRIAARHELAAWKRPRFHGDGFQETPGVPDDPEAPKLAEGVVHLEGEILKAIDGKGWSYFVSMEPDFDFVIEDIWITEGEPTRVLVLDTLTGKYFSLLVAMNEDGTVALGDPTPADITISIPEGEKEVAPIAAANVATVDKLRTGGTMALVQKTDVPKGTTPLYRVLLCSGGWTKDLRFITDDCLREAVSLGKFDGAKCWYNHPEPGTGGARDRLAVGFVKPGSVTIETNKAGHVDVWGDIALMRSTGTQIQEFLDQSLEIGVPLLGASVYCRETENHQGQIDGRPAQIFTRLISEKVAVDFVDDPAFPRAVATEKLAASAVTSSAEGELTVNEKERLAQLEAENAELKAKEKKRSALAARAKNVDAELKETGWPEEFAATQRPILLSIEDKNVRAAQIATMNLLLGRKAPVTSGRTNGPTDLGGGRPSVLSEKMQAELAALAKERGWKDGAIERAEATAFARQ